MLMMKNCKIREVTHGRSGRNSWAFWVNAFSSILEMSFFIIKAIQLFDSFDE